MWIVINVDYNEFQTFTDVLRIHGTIVEAPIDKGLHHSHNVKVGSELELIPKGGLSATDDQLLREAVDAGLQPRTGIIVVESDEVLLFEVAAQGMRDISQFTLRGGGKREKKASEVRKAFLTHAAKSAAQVFADEMPLVICGPGMARDSFTTMLRENGHGGPLMNVATSIGGRPAANEVLAEGLADELLGQHSLSRQIKLLESALARISTDGAVAYGEAVLIRAKMENAIETLLISADLLRDEERPINGQLWSDWVQGVVSSGGEVVQCSTDHDSGQQLDGMGGVIALLRWKLG
jgi:mRNA surveillance protein pelota